MFSARVGRIGESATLSVAQKAQELRSQGVEVVDFGAGEPDFPSPPCAVEAATEALAGGLTRYTATAGLPALRKALAARFQREYGAPWSPDHCFVGVGAKGVLFELALSLFQSGDQVVLPSPYWVSFPEQFSFCGAETVSVPTAPQDGFTLHAEPLLDAITSRTKAVLINSPCNPTGGLIPAVELQKLVAGAAERGTLVIADETYERFVYDDEGHASVASLASQYPDTVVLVGSFSKTYAMTGWRLGYALGPQAIIRSAVRIQGHATSNATSFAMAGAVAALEHAEPDVAKMIAEYRSRCAFVSERLNAMPGVDCVQPKGAFYAFPRVADHYGPGRGGSVEFCQFLLEEAGVAVVPGVAFGDDDHIRISFACAREELERGLSRMGEVLG